MQQTLDSIISSPTSKKKKSKAKSKAKQPNKSTFDIMNDFNGKTKLR